MIDVNEFIANLSPEQVAEFMQKLSAFRILSAEYPKSGTVDQRKVD